MNAKKVVGFLVLRSAFTQRNFASLLLVAVFFGVYVLSGGKISTALPKIPDSTSFGSIPVEGYSRATPRTEAPAEKEKALEVLGVKPSADRTAREQSLNERGRLFSPDTEDAEQEKIDKKGLITGDPQYSPDEARLRKFEKRSGDSLAIIEERLNIKRH